MPAFVGIPSALHSLAVRCRGPAVTTHTLRPASCPAAAKRRRGPRACAKSPLEDSAPAQNVMCDDIVSDEDYVVVDSKEVAMLVEELQLAGLDDLSSSDDEEGLSEDFLTLAEKRSDEWNGRAPLRDASGTKGDAQNVPGTGEEYSQDVGMKYFHDDHVQFMPSWAAQAYRNGEHRELEDGASRVGSTAGAQRLHDIVARKKAGNGEELKNARVGADGIVDCTVEDVADDYSVPIEFVVDALLHFGVPVPIRPQQSIRNCMTTEEIEKLLTLIGSFDAQDLSDRYSDKTISELADDYDLPVEGILDVCQKEGLYVCLEEQTRLSVVREDRVLDIILQGEPMGQPYPSMLQGLL